MRLFIGFVPDDASKTLLMKLEENLKEDGIAGRFAPEANLHMTAVFIGNADSAPVISVLEKLRFAPTTLQTSGIGSFGKLKYVKVEPDAAIVSMVKQIRQGLDLAHISYDRKPFFAHVTLIRKCAGTPDDHSVPSSLTFDRLVLFESCTENGTLVYKPLYTVKN